MEGIGRGKGFVTKINLMIGLFLYKTQQITNLIQYGGTIHVTFTYITTNTTNGLTSDQLPCTHNYPFVCIDLLHVFNLFQLQCIFPHILLPYFIIETHYKLHVTYAWMYIQIPMYDTLLLSLTCIHWFKLVIQLYRGVTNKMVNTNAWDLGGPYAELNKLVKWKVLAIFHQQKT